MEMCVFIGILQNIFRSWAIIFFSKSSGRSLDKLCVSFVKNESESNRIIVSNYVITYEKKWSPGLVITGAASFLYLSLQAYFEIVEQAFLSTQLKPVVIISNELVYASCLTSCRTT